ncbi:MAG: hypothetical protein CBE33_05490 [Candidatus Pelagibacter sp. TMED273]|nr:MAG: hypothetical protein CBE33_05490 [Candidatus Pelagibacter sp. TMED273]
MSSVINLSVILPTFNEEENLKFLIPDLIENFSFLANLKYEIIVIDDNSNDNTLEVVNKFNENYKNVRIYIRDNNPSLPMSIYDGIEKSNFDNVMWLDADGSMPAFVAKQLIEKFETNRDSVIIGSRFVVGGGYKGIESDGNNSFFKIFKNIYKSEDSLIAVFLSRIFNFLLIFLLKSKVKDLTSGFIVGKKEYFKKESFSRANYGDYFVYLMSSLKKQNVETIEVGYICLTRQFGKSKTANNVVDLALKGWPYIKAAIISRIDK